MGWRKQLWVGVLRTLGSELRVLPGDQGLARGVCTRLASVLLICLPSPVPLQPYSVAGPTR